MYFSTLFSLRWFVIDFFARGLHTRTARELTLALAKLSCLHQTLTKACDQSLWSISSIITRAQEKDYKTSLTSVEGVEIVDFGRLFTAEPKRVEAEIGHLQYKPAVDNAIWTFQVAMTTNVRAVYVAHCLRHRHPNNVIINRTPSSHLLGQHSLNDIHWGQ